MAAGSFCKAACSEPATQLCQISCLQIWRVLALVMQDETLDNNFNSENSAVTRIPLKLILPCLPAIQTGRCCRHEGCYLNNLLYSWLMRPACSWHTVVIHTEKAPAKMQLFKILFGLFLPLLVLDKSKQKRFFLDIVTKPILQN